MIYKYKFISAKEQLKRAVWNKGTIIRIFDESNWRRDYLGSLIQYSNHGDTGSAYGWEISHILSIDNGGTDNLTNLRPLQWENNRKKGKDSSE